MQKIDMDELEDLQDDMMDMQEDQEEMNEIMGQNFATGDVDENELLDCRRGCSLCRTGDARPGGRSR